MNLTLLINGKEKTFTAPFISARMFRRTIEITKQFNLENPDVDTVDAMVDYIVELFGKQFTRDELYDGLPARELVTTITRCVQEVSGQMTEATKEVETKNE